MCAKFSTLFEMCAKIAYILKCVLNLTHIFLCSKFSTLFSPSFFRAAHGAVPLGNSKDSKELFLSFENYLH